MKNMLDNIKQDLVNLGVRKGGILLVHSSLRSLGDFANKAELLARALLETLGENGTLLVPALSYETIGRENPYFDVRRTPSCVGGFTEYFRQRDDTIRSVHPTHSVCGIGPLAPAILADNLKDRTPCGPNSPFHKLKSLNGQILFIGCGLRPNTSMHALEELVEPPYLFGKVIRYTITDRNGSQFVMAVKSHNFKGWEQRYDRLEQVLELKKGPVLAANCYLIEANVMWDKVHSVMKAEPLFFVDRTEKVSIQTSPLFKKKT